MFVVSFYLGLKYNIFNKIWRHQKEDFPRRYRLVPQIINKSCDKNKNNSNYTNNKPSKIRKI